MFTAISMAICLLVVFVYVVYKTRQINVSGSDGYFLAGRSLTGGVICATILLTNLSTEPATWVQWPGKLLLVSAQSA